MTRQYRSKAMASIQPTARVCTRRASWDKQTMREFDEACLTSGPTYDGSGNPRAAGTRRGEPGRFRALSERHRGLTSQWERGEKHPRGASLKLLSLIAKRGLRTVA